jgi:hypothetical protein
MVRRIVAMQAGEMMTQMPDQDAEDGSGVTPEMQTSGLPSRSSGQAIRPAFAEGYGGATFA